MNIKQYRIVARYLDAGVGWRENETPFEGTYEAAGREASRIATALDRDYGDSHFWTVDLYGVDDTYGSYYQLFHGRTS